MSIYTDLGVVASDFQTVYSDISGALIQAKAASLAGNLPESYWTNMKQAAFDINTVNQDYATLANDQYALMTQQDNTKRILNREYNRLVAKKESMDGEISMQQRMTLLNDSYAARYSAYNYILMVIVVTILIFIVIVTAKKMIPIIPDALVNVASILLFAFAILYVTYLWYDIVRRDNIEFNKIDQGNLYTPAYMRDASLNYLRSTTVNSDGTDNGSILQNITCIGSDCCAQSGMYYDYTQNKCVDGIAPISQQQGFTTIKQSASASDAAGNIKAADSTGSALTYSKYP